MPQLRTSQNRAMGLTAGNLSANFSRIHPFEHVCDRGYAIPYETVSDDEAKLAIGGTRDARAIFGDKFSESREIKDLGRQEFLYDFFMFCAGHRALPAELYMPSQSLSANPKLTLKK
jgi:hypothetical protein